MEPKTTVLMADDEADILEIMAKKVTAAGYHVITASNGRLAWERIISESPDVVVLDLNMPEMGGYEVLKKLREEPPSAKWQPVIIVSAQGEFDDVKKGMDLEADHHLIKPCRVEEIIKAINLMVTLIPHRKS